MKDLTNIDIENGIFEVDMVVTFRWLVYHPEGADDLASAIQPDDGNQNFGDVWVPKLRYLNLVDDNNKGARTYKLRITDQQLNARNKILDLNVVETYWPGCVCVPWTMSLCPSCLLSTSLLLLLRLLLMDSCCCDS